MFFANSVVFVEGREDVAYLKSYLEVKSLWDYVRKLGCHIIPVDKKSELLRPVAVAIEIGIPFFVMFDADGDVKEHQRALHMADNGQLFSALGIEIDGDFPEEDIFTDNAVVWSTNLTDKVRDSVNAQVWNACREVVDAEFGHSAGMKKNVMHIARMVEELHEQKAVIEPLSKVSDSLLKFAGHNSQGVDASSAPA